MQKSLSDSARTARTTNSKRPKKVVSKPKMKVSVPAADIVLGPPLGPGPDQAPSPIPSASTLPLSAIDTPDLSLVRSIGALGIILIPKDGSINLSFQIEPDLQPADLTEDRVKLMHPTSQLALRVALHLMGEAERILEALAPDQKPATTETPDGNNTPSHIISA